MASRRLLNQLLNSTIDSAVSDAVDSAVTLRFGKVTAVQSSAKTLTVTVAGTTLRGVPYMKSYTSPAVNDVVWLLHQDSTVVAIGSY